MVWCNIKVNTIRYLYRYNYFLDILKNERYIRDRECLRLWVCGCLLIRE